MAQATLLSAKRGRKKNHSGNSNRNHRFLSLRTSFVIAVWAIPLYLLRLESIVYRGLRRNQQREDEDTILAKSLHYGTANFKSNPKQVLTPVSRNGFLSRGSLRSPIVASPRHTSRAGKLTFDYLEIELERMRRINTQEYNGRQETREENQLLSTIRPLPRTITLDESMEVTEKLGDKRTSTPKTAKMIVLKGATMGGDDADNDKGSLLDFERPFYDDCDRVLTKLPSVHPTCNTIHEYSLSTMETEITLLSMKGSWRSVWKVDFDHPNHRKRLNNTKNHLKNETLSSLASNVKAESEYEMQRFPSASAVLKMLHLHRRFDRDSYEAHSTDIMVMDRLTASSYVVDAYGFCGQSVVTEFASSTGRDYVKRYDIGSRDRMRVARDLARGLADIQALQPLPHDKIVANDTKNGAYDESPSIPVVFAHNDINIANTVMVNGRIKWNDFNIGVFMRKERHKVHSPVDDSTARHHRPPNGKNNIKSNDNIGSPPSTISFTAFTEENKDKIRQLCPAPVKYQSDMWRSPEEIKNVSYVQTTKTDIYGLANILYQTMTRHQPWTYKEPGGALSKTDIADRKLIGTMPTIPEQYLNTTKRELQILFAATNACFFPIPKKRPSARRLAFGLGSLYDKLKKKERVSRQQILDYLLPRG